MQDILNGLLIFNKYEPDCSTSAEHDEFRAGSEITKRDATTEELVELEALNWMWDEENDCYLHFT